MLATLERKLLAGSIVREKSRFLVSSVVGDRFRDC